MAISVQPLLGYPFWVGAAQGSAVENPTSTFVVSNTNYGPTSLYGGSLGLTALGGTALTTYKGNFQQLVNTTSTAINLVGFQDGEQRAKLFYTDGSTIALPTVATVILDLYWNGAFGVAIPSYEFGTVKLIVTYATGSTDAASPSQFTLDQNTLLLVAGSAYG